MQTALWRRVAGPVVATATANAVLLLDRSLRLPPPAPGALMLAVILFSAFTGGLTSGLLSAVIAIGYGVVLLSEPGRLFVMAPDHLFRFMLLVTFALIIPVIVDRLKSRAVTLLRRERSARARVEAVNRELSIVRAALDKVDYGVLLLDENLRVRFMNEAYRQIWRLSPAEAELRPTFVDLLQYARDAGAYAIRPSELDAYVARRVALVRLGEETPVDVRLATGETLRVECKVLPDGGRFLSYGNVTDLVRQAEQFERLATTDDLTGVCNRRHYLALATEEFSRHLLDRRPLALLILDIDLFKSINDRFGHAVGDAVIRHVAGICREEKRASDILARIGGEEFVLVLPNTPIEQAMTSAERIRKRLELSAVMAAGKSMCVTASFGVADADDGVTSLGELMRRADQALYEAKRGGRNRVRCAVPRPSREPRPGGASVATA